MSSSVRIERALEYPRPSLGRGRREWEVDCVRAAWEGRISESIGFRTRDSSRSTILFKTSLTDGLSSVCILDIVSSSLWIYQSPC